MLQEHQNGDVTVMACEAMKRFRRPQHGLDEVEMNNTRRERLQAASQRRTGNIGRERRLVDGNTSVKQGP